MTEASSGIEAGTAWPQIPRGLAWVIYAQLAATIAMVVMWRCDPATCSILFDELRRPVTIVNLFGGFGPPLIGVLAPATILVISVWKRVGWKTGLFLLSLSLVMSFIKLGVWVQMWS